MKNRNYLFIFVILLISLIFFTFNNFLKKDSDTVQIYLNSKLYHQLPLDTDCTFVINSANTIVIENGYVYMKSADCPDKLCIMQGKIKNNSKDIICLPNKVRICVSEIANTDAISQ